MIEPTDLDWLALCLCTESNRPEEWPCIAQVIENRLKSGRWGKTYTSVVLARSQFSAFNAHTRAPFPKREDDPTFLSDVFRSMTHAQDALLLMRAAAFVGSAGPGDYWTSTVSRETLHYYSPASMKPPAAAQAERLYTPPGLDPERFVFAEGVP
jgi:hypothetical protein